MNRPKIKHSFTLHPLVHKMTVFPLAIMLALLPFFVKSQSLDYNQMESMLDSLVTKNQFSGSIIVDLDSQKEFRYTGGYASRNPNVRLNSSTNFEIASLTKQFTAALILKLYEEGLLSLQDKFGKYIDWYPDAYKNKVAVHHLLAHQSGIPNYTNEGNWPVLSAQDFDQVDFVDQFLNGKALEFEPGSSFSYSNSNYYILGLIVEEVSQKKFEELLDEYIFRPLEMNNSGTLENRDALKELAEGYEKLANGYIDTAPTQSYSTAFSVSGLYSTPEDLRKWSMALDNNQIFADSTLNKMLTPNLADYGYGMLISDINPKLLASRIRNPFTQDEQETNEMVRCIWHWGANPGYNTLFLKITDIRLTIIILENLTKLGTDRPTLIPELAQDIVMEVMKH